MKNTLVMTAIFSLLFLGNQVAFATETPAEPTIQSQEKIDQVNQILVQLDPYFQDVFPYLNRVEKAPHGFYIYALGRIPLPFHSKESLREAIDRVLLGSAQALGGSNLTLTVQKIRSQRDEVKQLSDLAHTLEQRIRTAPESSSSFLPSFLRKKTKNELRAEQREALIEKARLEADILVLRTAMINILIAFQPTLDQLKAEKQVNALLHTVTGNSDIQIISAFENLKLLSQYFEEQIRSQASHELKRTYIGQHALLVRAMISFHSEYLRRISEWKQNLDRIKSNSESLIQSAHKLREDLTKKSMETSSFFKQLTSNISTLERTINISLKYQIYLDRQAENARKRMDALSLRYQVLENTYFTFQIISDIYEMVSQIRQTDSLMNDLELSETQVYFDFAELDEIERLSLQILN